VANNLSNRLVEETLMLMIMDHLVCIGCNWMHVSYSLGRCLSLWPLHAINCGKQQVAKWGLWQL